jgi:hypothetical protein
MSERGWDDWYQELKSLHEEYGWVFPDCPEEWREHFDEGYTPKDAFVEANAE